MTDYCTEFVDLFSRLKGTPNLLEKILDYLDFVSLKNIQCVCKVWNEAVNNGKAWGKQLQYHLASKVAWKQIHDQLPESTCGADAESAVCQDKETFRKVFLSAQKLEKNWKKINCKVNMIKLDGQRHNNSEHQDFVKDLLTMNAQHIAAGFIPGDIKVYDRKTLKLKMDLNHGYPLQYLKLAEEHLISASGNEVKIWQIKTGKLVQVVRILPDKKLGDMIGSCFGYGHGLFVCNQNLEVILSDGSSETSVKMSVWRLKENDSTKPIELVHEKTSPSSYFLASSIDVSEKFILICLQRDESISKPKRSRTHNDTIEVRSTTYFDLIHTVKERERIDCFSFANDKLLYQLDRTYLKLLDCDKRTVTDVSYLPLVNQYCQEGKFSLQFLGSNSRVAIGSLDYFFFNAGLFDLKTMMQQVPSIDFNKCFIERLKSLELAANWERSVNLQDFIMDELSILQYRRRENQWNGEVDCKLVVIDF